MNEEARKAAASAETALDQAYKEWIRKPFTAIGYGGTGGVRAVDHLRILASAPAR